jgi:hypothetical protein
MNDMMHDDDEYVLVCGVVHRIEGIVTSTFAADRQD